MSARPALLRLALSLVVASAWLIPRAGRREWQREWNAEIRGHGVAAPLRTVLRSLGAPLDALALRWTEHTAPGLATDLRDAARSLRGNRLSSFLAVLVLALGLAASAAVWTAMRDVLLAPLPYPQPDRLVAIWDRNLEQGIEQTGSTPANVTDWRERNRVFSGLTAWYAGEPRTLDSSEGAAKVAVAQVTEDFFAVVGTPPSRGRTFLPEEVARQDTVVVLSDALWRTRFGGDPNLIGSTVTIDDVAYEVIGVMPPGFGVPDESTVLWLPWDFERVYARLGYVPRDFRYLHVLARLHDDVSLEQAREDLERVAARLADEYPVNRGWSPVLTPYKTEILGDLGPALLALFAAVGIVLVVAVANATNLVLARLVGRRSELAVRSALGAGRWRLLRLVVLETLVLTAAAVGLAVALAGAGVAGFLRLAPEGLPRIREIGFGAGEIAHVVLAGVVIAALMATTATAALRLQGAASAVRVRTGAADVGRRRLPGGLVVAQVGSTFILVVMALLMFRSLSQLLVVDPGFEPSQVLVARVFPDPLKYDTGAVRLAYFDELFEQLESLPGVRSVGASSGLPMNPYNNSPSVLYANSAAELDDAAEAEMFMTTVGYPETMGMRLLDGRAFDGRDDGEATQVLVVNERLARSLWPDGDAVGRSLWVRFSEGRDFEFRIVGMVADTRTRGLDREPHPQAFRPHRQATYVTMNVVIRADFDDPAALIEQVRAAVLEIDPSQPVHSFATLAEMVDQTVATDRLALWLLGALGGIALALAGAGAYGVMAYDVRTRTHEVGLRMALGARRGEIAALVLRRGSGLLAAGLALGVGGALLAGRLLAALLYEVRPTDPALYLLAGGLVAAALITACWLPARRAARIDPAVALRAEA